MIIDAHNFIIICVIDFIIIKDSLKIIAYLNSYF